jgi:hypothetical protein
VTRWLAALYQQIAEETTLQFVTSHDCKPLFLLVELVSCSLDDSMMRDAIDTANADGVEQVADFELFERFSFTRAQILRVEGLRQRCGVSFDKQNGISGNLLNKVLE